MGIKPAEPHELKETTGNKPCAYACPQFRMNVDSTRCPFGPNAADWESDFDDFGFPDQLLVPKLTKIDDLITKIDEMFRDLDEHESENEEQ